MPVGSEAHLTVFLGNDVKYTGEALVGEE